MSLRYLIAVVITLGFFVAPAAAQPAPVENADADNDGDGLSNAEEAQLGSDPERPDTDGDGLIDGWEVHGVPAMAAGQQPLLLSTYGATPLHQDIFVWMDYMVVPNPAPDSIGLRPNDYVIETIRQTFANGAVRNPDGTDGINIHLVVGNDVPFTPVIDFGPDEDHESWRQFHSLRTKLSSQQLRVFHQMIWANEYVQGDRQGSSGYAELNGQFFVVTLGGWRYDGSEREKIGTFIHELGHNLGLHHGSSEDVNYKANHLSVMNYTYQLVGLARGEGDSCTGRFDIAFDYQRSEFPGLAEADLDERTGLGAAYNYRVFYNGCDWPSDGPIDWNMNGRTDVEHVTFDINPDLNRQIHMRLDAFGGTPNEWQRLNMRAGSIGLPLGTSSQLPCSGRLICPMVLPLASLSTFERTRNSHELSNELTREMAARLSARRTN